MICDIIILTSAVDVYSYSAAGFAVSKLTITTDDFYIIANSVLHNKLAVIGNTMHSYNIDINPSTVAC